MYVCLLCKLAYDVRFPLNISLLCVKCWWQATPFGQVSVGMVRRHISNPPANRKQSVVISLNKKTVQYGRYFKTTRRHFFTPKLTDLHITFIRARSISLGCPFKCFLSFLLNSPIRTRKRTT